MKLFHSPELASRTVLFTFLGLVAVASPATARDHAAPALKGDRAATGTTLEEPPRYGIYYDRREPSFYTGFAPRTFDPARLHVHLGRGNQLRVTAVLAEEVLREYARDLLERRRAYRSFINGRQILLTQNRAFDDFERRLSEVELDRLVGQESALSAEEVRERNLALLERLNPGRVFRIRIPVENLVRSWAAEVRPADRVRMDAARRLEVLNLMLPTRLWVAQTTPGVGAALEDLVRRVPEPPYAPGTLDAVTPAFLALLERVSGAMYPARDGVLTFDEFTAVYPVGTFNSYTSWNGRAIPQYPTPGRRALTTHQRTKTVDHIPTDESYSYSPWLPYMHVGTNMHNSIHTLWWKMDTAAAEFLPPAWRDAERGSRDGKPYQYLWLLSRGPMSHGCTHLNAGHIAELRQLLPSETEKLYEVDVFLNKSQLYDVFDIDGDLEPEVMGVRYFIAYSLKDERPHRLRARNERHAFYDWLYAGELRYDAKDQGFLEHVRDGRFAGRSAVDGAEYARVPLREADYQLETIQFYQLVDIPFARELRKVGLRHPFPELEIPRQARAAALVGVGR